MEKIQTPEIIYYAIDCPVCDDLFRDLFIFCVQNVICYEVKRHVKNLEEPTMRWKDTWFTGGNMINEFKDQWRTQHAV
jgi:hypothetical protein